MCIRVLIADSDGSLLQTYCEHLSRMGFDVATARNGLDCVARLRGFHPDVLVIEMDMPWGGGVGVLDLIRNGPELPHLPVLILSARRNFADFEERLLFDSSCECQIKPLKPEQLAGIIRRLLNRRSASPASRETSLGNLNQPTPQSAVNPSTDTLAVSHVWKDEELEPCAPRKN